MADRRGIIVPLIILAFIFLSPDSQRGPTGQLRIGSTFEDVIAKERRSLSELQNSSYVQAGFDRQSGSRVNLTGLELARGYAWDELVPVQNTAKEHLRNALGHISGEALSLTNLGDKAPPLYENVTGFVHGRWARSNLGEKFTAPQLNMTEYAPLGPFGPLKLPRTFARNLTGAEGDLKVRFLERQVPKLSTLEAEIFDNVTDVGVELSLTDDATLEEHDLRMYGVYFPHVGQAILTTTSDKLAGIFALPHLALSEQMFDVSKKLLNESITATIQRQIDSQTLKLNPWSSKLDGEPANPYSAPSCELVVFLQQIPPIESRGPVGRAILSSLEWELKSPTGASLPIVPELRFSMVAFSPDCGYVIESKGPPKFAPHVGTHLTGPKAEVAIITSRHHLLLFTSALALQLALLVRQMREASTPSTRSRISLYCIALLALGDGFTFMSFLLASFFVSEMWVSLLSAAFVAFSSVSFFGMRFLMDIWGAQTPERERRARAQAEEDRRREEQFRAEVDRLREQRRQRTVGESTVPATHEVAPSTTENVTRPSSLAPQIDTSGEQTSLRLEDDLADVRTLPTMQPTAGSLPLPVTAQRPAEAGTTPVFMPSDQQGLDPVLQPSARPQAAVNVTSAPSSFGSLYTRFYVLLLVTLFMSLNAVSWPAPMRRAYFTILGLIYLSFWLPQIKRNVQRNCRYALNWEYVLGQSGLRLLPFVYFYGYSDNVFYADTDFVDLALLASWLCVQILLLASQELIGPRWFVRKEWTTPAYDYHPVLRDDEEDASMPIGFSQTSPASPPERKDSSSTTRRGSVSVKDVVERGKRVFDCAICMQDLEVPVIGSGSTNTSGAAGLLARRMYMVTPCRHIFHSACLEGWMKYRLQCPICREDLPPL